MDGFSPNLVCILILWRSGLGLLLGKFCQILTELSARSTPKFSFPDDNLSKYQGILTKLSTCIDIKEICLGLLMGKFCQCLTELSARDTIMAGYYSLTFLFFPEKRLCHFVQIVSTGDNLQEMSKPVFRKNTSKCCLLKFLSRVLSVIPQSQQQQRTFLPLKCKADL